MTPDEIRKLLGGYATGTLSETERNLLFSAALEDQELFNLLADEEVLRELLEEPATRQILIEELQRQPALEAMLFKEQRAPLDHATHAVSAPLSARRKLPESFWVRIWDGLTPRRLAVAGGLAMILLIAGGIQYKRLHSPEPSTVANVNPAMTGALERDTSPVREQAEATTRSVKPPTSGSALSRAEPRLSRNEENRTEVPPTVPRETADAEAKAEKETADAGQAREQLNQAVREQVAEARAKETESARTPPPPATRFSAPLESSGSISERQSAPVSPAQIVTGGLRRASKAGSLVDQFRETNGKVTDVNGAIVTINMGSNVGFKAGDTIEIVRDNRVIATSKLSQVGSTFAVGTVQPVAGIADAPRPGDAVRRAGTSQPPR
ncbi:MAG: hypothetical protein ACXVBC_07805 [Bdellovibrionota bacterium]